jgi:hypothetical protein
MKCVLRAARRPLTRVLDMPLILDRRLAPQPESFHQLQQFWLESMWQFMWSWCCRESPRSSLPFPTC